MSRRTALVLTALFGVSGSASADDLFSITATNGGTTITATDSDVIDLSEAAIETFGAFAPLSGTSVVSTLNYAGVPNAVRYTVNAAGTSATLEFPITGFSRVFTGVNADDLAEQIEDFVLEDGADEYADLLKAIRGQSVAAVLDGNPGATTARLARHTFDLYGTGTSGPGWASPNRVEFRRDDEALAGTYPVYAGEPGFEDGGYESIGWFEITPIYESTEAGDFDGDTAAIHAAGGYYFNDVLGGLGRRQLRLRQHRGHRHLPLDVPHRAQLGRHPAARPVGGVVQPARLGAHPVCPLGRRGLRRGGGGRRVLRGGPGVERAVRLGGPGVGELGGTDRLRRRAGPRV